MSSVVLDTHAVIWYLEQSPLLSTGARGAIKAAVGAGYPVFVSSISLAEMVYLEDRRRIAQGMLDRLLLVLRQPASGLIEAPFDALVAEAMRKIKREVVPDMPDRMIAATALHLGLPLVTTDSAIRASGIPTIW